MTFTSLQDPSQALCGPLLPSQASGSSLHGSQQSHFSHDLQQVGSDSLHFFSFGELLPSIQQKWSSHINSSNTLTSLHSSHMSLINHFTDDEYSSNLMRYSLFWESLLTWCAEEFMFLQKIQSSFKLSSPLQVFRFLHKSSGSFTNTLKITTLFRLFSNLSLRFSCKSLHFRFLNKFVVTLFITACLASYSINSSKMSITHHIFKLAHKSSWITHETHQVINDDEESSTFTRYYLLWESLLSWFLRRDHFS